MLSESEKQLILDLDKAQRKLEEAYKAVDTKLPSNVYKLRKEEYLALKSEVNSIRTRIYKANFFKQGQAIVVGERVWICDFDYELRTDGSNIFCRNIIAFFPVP